MHVCMYLCVCVCLCMYVCMYIVIYLYTYLHIYVYIRTQTNAQQAMLFIFVFMGMVGGYTAARLFRLFKGTRSVSARVLVTS